MQHRFGKFMEFQGGEYGMAVLSRLPVTRVENIRLPDGDEPELARKRLVLGLLDAVGVSAVH